MNQRQIIMAKRVDCLLKLHLVYTHVLSWSHHILGKVHRLDFADKIIGWILLCLDKEIAISHQICSYCNQNTLSTHFVYSKRCQTQLVYKVAYRTLLISVCTHRNTCTLAMARPGSFSNLVLQLLQLLILAYCVAATFSNRQFCGRPRVPAFGGFHGSSRRFFTRGNVVNYFCRPGYRMHGTGWTVCTYDGRQGLHWRFPPPFCRPRKYCVHIWGAVCVKIYVSI